MARICGVGHCTEESCAEKGLEGYKPGFSVDFFRRAGLHMSKARSSEVY